MSVVSHFEFPHDRDVITIAPLAEVYTEFDAATDWEERTNLQAAEGFSPDEFCLGLKEVSLGEDPIRWLASQNRPKNLLQSRVGLLGTMLAHAESEMPDANLAYSGRNGAQTLCSGAPFRTPEDGRVWATPASTWKQCIGESFNNPFSYLLARQRRCQGRAEPFVPMIAAFDTDKLELADGNRYDKTSWKARPGQTILGSIACLYYFNPKSFVLQI